MNLPLYTIYSKFSSIYSYKSSEYDLCSYHIQESTPHFSEFRKVCRAVEKTLIYLNPENYKELDNCKPYEYISYFLYDKIKNIDTNNYFQTFYGILNSILSSHGKGKMCNIIEFNTNKDEFANKKELYFRGEIIHWIKLKYESYFQFFQDFCKNYLKECFQFYNQNIKDKYCKKLEHCEKEIESFSKNINETMTFLKEKKIDIMEEEIQLPPKTGCPSKEQKDSVEQQVHNQAHPGQQMVHVFTNPNPESVLIGSPNADTNVTAGTVSGTFLGISLLSLLFWKVNFTLMHT